MRLAVPRTLVCQDPADLSDKALKQRLLARAKIVVEPHQAGFFDRGFEPQELLESGRLRRVLSGPRFSDLAAPCGDIRNRRIVAQSMQRFMREDKLDIAW